MRLSVRHLTTYVYDPPAERCSLRVRLYPPSFDSQTVRSWSVSINGAHLRPILHTPSGEGEAVWSARQGGREIAIAAEGEVDTLDAAGVLRGLREAIRPSVYLRTTALTEADEAITALAHGVAGAGALDRMHALFNAVADSLVYTPGATSSATTAALALQAGSGVCQDHAHVFISAARTLQIPARYVVGYLMSSGNSLTETHAWAEAFIPDIGWVGFDAANRLCPTDRYVRLCCGLDAADAAPIRGSVQGAPDEQLSVHVDIGEVSGDHESARAQAQSQQ
jgi:transglutaminase-like putative cysteine protease